MARRSDPGVELVPLAVPVGQRAEEIHDEDPAAPKVGRWYWVKDTDKAVKDEDDRRWGGERWFGCVIYIGSNYVELKAAGANHSWTQRLHFNEFWDYCEFEASPETVIREKVAEKQVLVHELMGKVREITSRLAITPGKALNPGSETTALALRTDQPMDQYKAALVLAKEKELPELFKEIKAASEALGKWLSAQLIPLEAEAEALEPAIGAIKNRIFSVELYAGLVEQVVQVREGEPAAFEERIALMQRRAYMDEEILARYEVGGMSFEDIEAFDAWLARAENLNRILPFPRCIIAFKVRRLKKDREVVSYADFVKVLAYEEADKYTYLYIRNGEQLFRLRTGIEFDEKLFPDMDKRKLEGKIYAKIRFSDVEKLVSEDEYRAMLKEDKENKAKAKKDKAYYYDRLEVRDYVAFTQESVRYDDIVAHIQRQVTKHNRLVLVLQGLLDRSPVLHPHPPWSLWQGDGFDHALRLVYDDTRALVAGDMPDFEAYRARCNASLKAGSITVGQDEVWVRSEARKEAERRAGDHRFRGEDYWRERYRPEGNPGPGMLAYVSSYATKAKACTYHWMRSKSRDSWDSHAPKTISCTISVKAAALLNVDAYKPGDFRIFFEDPRTRAEYLKWAPLLLVAEEYHAGKRKLEPRQEPPPKKKTTEEGRRRYQRRKALQAMVGKAVKLVREVHTVGGTVYKKGTLWRLSWRRGEEFTLVGIGRDGKRDEEDERSVSGVWSSSFTIDPTVPAAPGGGGE
jgi:hypothetical protein